MPHLNSALHVPNIAIFTSNWRFKKYNDTHVVLCGFILYGFKILNEFDQRLQLIVYDRQRLEQLQRTLQNTRDDILNRSNNRTCCRNTSCCKSKNSNKTVWLALKSDCIQYESASASQSFETTWSFIKIGRNQNTLKILDAVHKPNTKNKIDAFTIRKKGTMLILMFSSLSNEMSAMLSSKGVHR